MKKENPRKKDRRKHGEVEFGQKKKIYGLLRFLVWMDKLY